MFNYYNTKNGKTYAVVRELLKKKVISDSTLNWNDLNNILIALSYYNTDTSPIQTSIEYFRNTMDQNDGEIVDIFACELNNEWWFEIEVANSNDDIEVIEAQDCVMAIHWENIVNFII